MIERQEPTDSGVKICTYNNCGVPFTRPANMHNGNWKQCTRCPKHRKMSGPHNPEPRLGHYEIKNPLIDAFLYGKLG